MINVIVEVEWHTLALGRGNGTEDTVTGPTARHPALGGNQLYFFDLEIPKFGSLKDDSTVPGHRDTPTEFVGKDSTEMNDNLAICKKF